jgi:hypothetical protein
MIEFKRLMTSWEAVAFYGNTYYLMGEYITDVNWPTLQCDCLIASKEIAIHLFYMWYLWREGHSCPSILGIDHVWVFWLCFVAYAGMIWVAMKLKFT